MKVDFVVGLVRLSVRLVGPGGSGRSARSLAPGDGRSSSGGPRELGKGRSGAASFRCDHLKCKTRTNLDSNSKGQIWIRVAVLLSPTLAVTVGVATS